MRTRRDKQIRYAREQSKRGETWVVEEVVGGYGKGRIQASMGRGCWWDSSIVNVIATYENGVKKSC